jgi:hypothetical protein
VEYISGCPVEDLDAVFSRQLQASSRLWSFQSSLSNQLVKFGHEIGGQSLIVVLPNKVHRMIVVEDHPFALVSGSATRFDHVFRNLFARACAFELAGSYGFFYQGIDEVTVPDGRVRHLLAQCNLTTKPLVYLVDPFPSPVRHHVHEGFAQRIPVRGEGWYSRLRANFMANHQSSCDSPSGGSRNRISSQCL